MKRSIVFPLIYFISQVLCYGQSDNSQMLIAVCDIEDAKLLENSIIEQRKVNDIEYLSATYDVFLLKCKVRQVLSGEYHADTISMVAYRKPYRDRKLLVESQYSHALLLMKPSAQGNILLGEGYNSEVFETTDRRWFAASKEAKKLPYVLLPRDSIHSVKLMDGQNTPFDGVDASLMADAWMKFFLHHPNNCNMRDSAFYAGICYEPVDMGLSVNWASCNVGASCPEEPGGYFAWGEISEKEYYSEDNYKWYERGTVDNKAVLDFEDDAAAVLSNGEWRMPTASECNELRRNCTIEFIEQNGTFGYRLISKLNGNSIFLPSSGWCDDDGSVYDDCVRIWTSSMGDGAPPVESYCFEIVLRGREPQNPYPMVNGDKRYRGYPIRPVCSIRNISGIGQ